MAHNNRIPVDVIERILSAANIVDLIGKEVTLSRAGANMKGLCPFHDDHHPTMMVSPAKGIYKCFACGAGGNVIDFFKRHENLSYPEAVRLVGQKVGIEIPQRELTPEEQQRNDDCESCRIVLDAAQKVFEGALATHDPAREYLAQRDCDPMAPVLSTYHLGYAPGGDYVTKALLSQGYKEEYLLMSGVSVRKEGKKIRDKFFNRIMFPIYNRRGQIVGYTGRDIGGQSPAKYMNTEETILFKKGHELYGFFQARQAIARRGFAYVVEGQFDVLSMVANGVDNVVAGSGTAFTPEQRRLLHNVTTDLVLIYDGDKAGEKAAARLIEAAVEQRFAVRCVGLSDGTDPDELARRLGGDTQGWLEAHTVSYVEALYRMKWKECDTAHQHGRVLKEIAHVIAMEAEEVRTGLIRELATLTGEKVKTITSLVENDQAIDRPDGRIAGFHGWELCEDLVDKTARSVNVTPDWDYFVQKQDGRQPWLFLQGIPSENQYQELNRKVHRMVFHHIDLGTNSLAEPEHLQVMRQAFLAGITVDVSYKEGDQGFLYVYARFYADYIERMSPTPEQRNICLQRVAEMISYAPSSIQTVHLSTWAEMLKLKTAALRELVKPFNAERKAANRMEQERGDLDEYVRDFDSERIPQYVQDNEEYRTMLRQHGFFPVLSKKTAEPVCYMFRTTQGQLKRVGDFYMEPLFHIYSKESMENRRVVRLTSLYRPGCKYVALPSKSLLKLSTLDEQLIEEGAYNFENGSADDYAHIRAWMSYRFPLVEELKVLGQQRTGSFVWANAIWHEEQGQYRLDYADELGLLPDGERTYYSPAYSKVNIDLNVEQDPFEQDRWLTYEDVPEERRVNFGEWSQLMDEVYKVNDNGKFAIIYAVMCAFRSVIFRSLPNPFFTSIFFIGPTMSGKTQIALSIRSLFMKPEYPSFNLNSGTDAAFFSVLERFRDVPQVMEEYNDEEISDQKFQGLKSVTYDGDGKQKRKAATGNAIDTSKVNAPVILLGQEAPQRDDGALANRVVLCEVPLREDINEDHAREIFERLKDLERQGLSYLLVEVLRLRPLFQQHFLTAHKECVREIQQEVEAGGRRSGNQTRIINTVAMFLASCRILTQYAPHLSLPFTYGDFRSLCVQKVRSQLEMITSTNKLAAFFDIMDILIDRPQGGIRIGRDFRIVLPQRGEIRLKGGRSWTPPTPDTKLLYLRIDPVHQAYMRAFTGDHPLTKTTLMMNLRSDSAYIGEVSAFRFEWEEAVERASEVVAPPNDNPFPSPVTQANPNRAALRYMEHRQTTTSAVVLNYTLLSQHYAKDFERTPG